jgi:hypothetical protein
MMLLDTKVFELSNGYAGTARYLSSRFRLRAQDVQPNSFLLGLLQPSPEDLLRQLNEPIQIRAIFESLTQIDSVFAIGKDAFGLTKEWYRKSQTLSEIARIFGFDAQEAKDDSRRMKKQVEFWNRRLERGRLIAQERAFREKRKRTLD